MLPPHCALRLTCAFPISSPSTAARLLFAGLTRQKQGFLSNLLLCEQISASCQPGLPRRLPSPYFPYYTTVCFSKYQASADVLLLQNLSFTLTQMCTALSFRFAGACLISVLWSLVHKKCFAIFH